MCLLWTVVNWFQIQYLPFLLNCFDIDHLSCSFLACLQWSYISSNQWHPSLTKISLGRGVVSIVLSFSYSFFRLVLFLYVPSFDCSGIVCILVGSICGVHAFIWSQSGDVQRHRELKHHRRSEDWRHLLLKQMEEMIS